MLNHNNHFHVQGARPTAVFRMKGCFQSFDRIAQSGVFLPCFAGCRPTAHRYDRRFPIHSVCIPIIAPSYELRAGGLVGLRPKTSLDIARQHKVMTLLSAAVVLLTQGPPCEKPLEALRLQNPGGLAASAVGRNTPTPDRSLRRSNAKRQPPAFGRRSQAEACATARRVLDNSRSLQ